MDEKQLRTRVERRRGAPLPDYIWDQLRDDGYVSEALESRSRDVAFEDLVGVAQEKMNVWNAGKFAGIRRVIPGRTAGPRTGPRLNAGESARLSVLSWYYAKRAAEQSDVRSFRAGVLRGRELTDEEAARFLDSPAAQHLSLYEFNKLQIDPVAHVAEEVTRSQFGDDPPWSRTIRVSSSDSSVEVVLSRLLNGDHKLVPLQRTGHAFVAFVPAWPGSILDTLYGISDRLATSFHWAQDQATMFVLTGGVPRINALQTGIAHEATSFGSIRTVTLTVAAWISADTVREAYRAAQRSLLGADNRFEEQRSLRLFQFVEERTDENGKRPGWESLRTEWNRAHPEWRIEDRRRLSGRFNDVKKSLLYGSQPPDFGPPLLPSASDRVQSTSEESK